MPLALGSRELQSSDSAKTGEDGEGAGTKDGRLLTVDGCRGIVRIVARMSGQHGPLAHIRRAPSLRKTLSVGGGTGWLTAPQPGAMSGVFM
jgi:hypothetical protein